MNKAKKIFFENIGNRDTLLEKKIIKKEQAVVMPGAGVNTEEFYASAYPENDGTVRFVFIGRIMEEKGVNELFYAIEELKKEYNNLSFDFIGWYEDGYEKKVAELQESGLINFYGFQPNVKPFIEKSHCIVHPSWHEGMSNTLLEGASMQRPLITNNIHGCMEAVEDGVTGYLAVLRDWKSLYSKIKQFIDLPYDQKEKMGKKGRERMISVFEKQIVVEKTLREIGIKDEER